MSALVRGFGSTSDRSALSVGGSAGGGGSDSDIGEFLFLGDSSASRSTLSDLEGGGFGCGLMRMAFFRTGVDSRCGPLVGVFGCDCLLSSILSLSFLPLLLLLEAAAAAAEVERGGFFSPGDPRLLLLPVVVVVVVAGAAPAAAAAAWLLLSTSLEIIPPVFAAVLVPVAPDVRWRLGGCRLLFELAPEPVVGLALLLLMLFKLVAELD